MPQRTSRRRLRFVVIAIAMGLPSAGGAISGSPALESIRLAGEPRPESIAGLGVDLATGAQTLSRVVHPYDAGQPFSLVLRFDSAFSETSGPLGRGWRHDFQAGVTSEPGDRMAVSWGGHYRNTYRLVSNINGVRRFVSDDIAARRDDLRSGAGSGRVPFPRRPLDAQRRIRRRKPQRHLAADRPPDLPHRGRRIRRESMRWAEERSNAP